jgi:hypothetical protein
MAGVFEIWNPLTTDLFSPDSSDALTGGEWNNFMGGKGGHSMISDSDTCSLTCGGLWFEASFVNGNAILNDAGIDRPPRTQMMQFLITTSPNVFGGETRGFGNGPRHGFNVVLCGLSLISLFSEGQRKSELVGGVGLTCSATCNSSAAAGVRFGSSMWMQHLFHVDLCCTGVVLL